MLNFLRRIISQKIINIYHLLVAIAANFRYGFRSRRLHVIGVTGTDGKTTTTNLIAGVLRAGGLPVSFLTSINAQVGRTSYDTGLHTTTPSPMLLQQLLCRAVDEGSKYVVLEVTSHALDQHRVWGIDFETAVITNITQDHFDYHKTYERYAQAKGKLFAKAGRHSKGALILNLDDRSYGYLSKFPAKKILAYSLQQKAALWVDQITEGLRESTFRIHTPEGDFPVKLRLPGKYNVANALAAATAGFHYRISPANIKQGLESIAGVAGRMEFLDEGQEFEAMVDFAHTPNAIYELLSFLRPRVRGRLIIVFGSAGERDREKRALMGKAADRFADLVVLTREDNRSEKVMRICEQIRSGIRNKKFGEGYFIIPDRREALRFALRGASAGDLVVVTGKGHEQSLNVDGREVPWDDRVVVREELTRLLASHPRT